MVPSSLALKLILFIEKAVSSQTKGNDRTISQSSSDVFFTTNGIIKVFKDGSQLFIKSSILKSFSSEVIRTATVLLMDNVPKKVFSNVLSKSVVSVVMLLLYFYSWNTSQNIKGYFCLFCL